MKKRIMVFATAGMLAFAGLIYGFKSSGSSCPLEGTPDCPKLHCPLAGTPDCPYENGTVPMCCKKN
ncbi:MAG: hypothetical protein EPO28_13195 [Saprospiraceae bacterium]|nr:MAG: hypothetical protein EPO28_13195 [Saprospiraceae bacterium]